MNKTILSIIVLASAMPAFAVKEAKTYKHASQYQVATLDQTLRINTGSDITVSKGMTDAKMGGGAGQGIHLLYTEHGNYRVEAPVNKGRSFGLALAAGLANANRPVWAQVEAPTIHNKWFLDNVQSGTKVMFASECAAPNKKHPGETVRCTFWFPDPDSADHEYQTSGDFTPFLQNDGSNTQKAANVLCGKGKLAPEVEAQVCTSENVQKPEKPQDPGKVVSVQAAETSQTVVEQQ